MLFISYSQKNEALVDLIVAYLAKEQVNVRLNRDQIDDGEKLGAEIAKAILDCESFILILTGETVFSDRVKEEFTFARELNKKIIPVIYFESPLSAPDGWSLRLGAMKCILALNLNEEAVASKIFDSINNETALQKAIPNAEHITLSAENYDSLDKEYFRLQTQGESEDFENKIKKMFDCGNYFGSTFLFCLYFDGRFRVVDQEKAVNFLNEGSHHGDALSDATLGKLLIEGNSYLGVNIIEAKALLEKVIDNSEVPEANLILGRLVLKENSNAARDIQSEAYYESAYHKLVNLIEKGSLRAKLLMAALHIDHRKTQYIQHKECQEYLIESAKENYLPAIEALAWYYSVGSFMEMNHELAKGYIFKAIELNSNWAMCEAASNHIYGWVSYRKSMNKACFYLKKALQQNYCSALYLAAELLEKWPDDAKRHGVSDTPSELYQKGAEQGHASAQFCMGLIYTNGEGLEKNVALAAEWFRKAAEQGNASAQYCLGLMYKRGQGIEKSDVQALEWYRKAAEQGNPSAQFCLGMIYEKGQGVEKNAVLAAEWFQKAAEQGNASAQFFLGLMYEKGQGVEKSDVQAMEWYRKAAQQGNVSAQYFMGFMYRNGQSVEQCNVQALEWYRKAAEQGHADAQYRLGGMYVHGEGTEKNADQAAIWFREAAEQGHADAQYFLGWMYSNGCGVVESVVQSVNYFRKAAEQGHADAQYRLGEMCELGEGLERSDVQAAEWFQKAAEQGVVRAKYSLGMMYKEGRGIEKCAVKAAEWLLKAAEQSVVKAQYSLGMMFKEGQGIEKDAAQAVKWFREAAEQGNGDAQNRLGEMYELGEGVEKSAAMAAEWFQKAAEQIDDFDFLDSDLDSEDIV